MLKRAGFSRASAGLGALAVALEDCRMGDRPPDYVCMPDSSWGVRTRRRVRRERWNRRWRVLRRMLLYVLVYGASLAAVLLLAAGVCWLLNVGFC